jgi:DNA-binding SARP family transcriptional activator
MTFADLALGDGRLTIGLNALRYGLSLGREHGFEHVIGWQPDTVANLCVRALEEDIESAYVRRLITNSKLTPDVPPYHLHAWPWRYRIHSLGSFRFLIESKAVSSGPRSKGRPLELLKVLLANGAASVKADRLAETLWPHVDKDYAHKSFTINLHRIRKLFGDDDAVVLHDGLVALNPDIVWFDVWSLEQTFQNIDEALGKPLGSVDNDLLESLTDRVFDLYRGPFFGDDDEFSCFIEYRNQIRIQMARYVRKLTGHLEHLEAWEKAAESYERGIIVDPIEEGFYRQLIVCQKHLGHTGDALDTYERCRHSLWSAGQSIPSSETQALYDSLRNAS